ncbi:MAG: Asp-tRNA(Asn)/Glu-tRNA(Gln) amidotransferase GatCAB subunit A, partial [Pseudonocardiaceae bacterium]
MTRLTRWSAAELAARIHAQDITAVEVTRAHLDRITAVDPALHAFLHLDGPAALAAAAAVDDG